MVVREIKTHTEIVMRSFDYFNDYDDTRAYCVTNFPEILPRLDEGYQNFLKTFTVRTNNYRGEIS